MDVTCRLYATRYVEPGLQQDAIAYYAVPDNIAALLQKNQHRYQCSLRFAAPVLPLPVAVHGVFRNLLLWLL